MSDSVLITGNTYPVKEQLKALGAKWDKDSKGWRVPADKADEARSLVGPTPIYNSPPPTDLGTADPIALAKQFGRIAAADARVKSFTCYGLAKGDDGLPNGSIRRVNRIRYVQVARTKRRYLSRDWLEDMDLFDAQAGGSYQWDGVPVEETPEEIASDAAKKSEKNAKERPIKRRAEIEQLVRQPANHSYDGSAAGLARLWGESRMAGSETMYGDATRLVYVTSSYDDGPSYWELKDAALAAEAATLTLS